MGDFKENVNLVCAPLTFYRKSVFGCLIADISYCSGGGLGITLWEVLVKRDYGLVVAGYHRNVEHCLANQANRYE